MLWMSCLVFLPNFVIPLTKMQQHQNLIQRLKEKDQEAFSKIYDMYSAAIYGVVLKICRSEEIAQEVLQDVFLTVWHKSQQYDKEKASFYTWLYRIARNKSLNALRKLDDTIIQNENLSVYKGIEEQQENTVTIELEGSMNLLKPHHKKAIELIYFQGYTHREAHKVMDIPLGTFKSYVRQALKILKENYQKASLILLMLTHVLK